MEYPLREELLSKLVSAPLKGISQKLLEQHWGLYKGYVTNLNALRKELGDVTPDRRRRLGFETNGVVLHELYFHNLTPNPATPPPQVQELFAKTWGSFENYKSDLKKTGLTRGIGWAITYVDPVTKALSNHFIELHENGNAASLQPIVVMDVWEHAYILDQGAGGRGGYIDAFLENVDWEVVKQRIDEALAGKVVSRF